MTALTFPRNPLDGDTYSGTNGILYTYDGVKWVVTSSNNMGSSVTNFVQDSSASILANGTHNGIIVNYNTNTNELNLTLDIDGGIASTNF